MKTRLFQLLIVTAVLSLSYPIANITKSLTGNTLFAQTGLYENNSATPTQTSQWFWDFIKWNHSDGWTVTNPNTGVVTGGVLWLSVETEYKDQHTLSWKDQIWGSKTFYDLISPANLNIPASDYNKIVVRLRNMSPETDGYANWRTTGNPNWDEKQVRFTMKPDYKEWQEIVCHMDDNWSGTIDQIRIRPAQMWQRGDIWIDWIAITSGPPKILPEHADVCSDQVVPRIVLPGISQYDFNNAFKILDECMIVDVPIHGFNYPVMAPGGMYGTNWWQLDASLNVAGTKWVNQQFVESVMRGFAEVQAQNPDGRIDLWGGSPVRGQTADVSSLPAIFEAAFDVARRSHDSSLQRLIYETMKKYLGYWFSSTKRDKESGLITAVFEETFSNPHKDPGIIAPIDLNVAVAIGCYHTSKLGEYLGKNDESKKYSHDFNQLVESINRYLWNDEKNVYYNYYVKKKIHDPRLLCTTFVPMRLGIAPTNRTSKLLPILTDPALFNWGIRPVTTIARTEPEYLEATGRYDGSAWFGDVWTLRNLSIIEGLEHAGKHNLASELVWATIQEFNANYAEYIAPSTGSGEGVQRYGWTASQYIQTVIEHLFGIDYDFIEKRLRIIPHIPDTLVGQGAIDPNLIIPAEKEVRLDLSVLYTTPNAAKITIEIKGEMPNHTLEIHMPAEKPGLVTIKDKSGETVPVDENIKGLLNVAGTHLSVKEHTEFLFENLNLD